VTRDSRLAAPRAASRGLWPATGIRHRRPAGRRAAETVPLAHRGARQRWSSSAHHARRLIAGELRRRITPMSSARPTRRNRHMRVVQCRRSSVFTYGWASRRPMPISSRTTLTALIRSPSRSACRTRSSLRPTGRLVRRASPAEASATARLGTIHARALTGSQRADQRLVAVLAPDRRVVPPTLRDSRVRARSPRARRTSSGTRRVPVDDEVSRWLCAARWHAHPSAGPGSVAEPRRTGATRLLPRTGVVVSSTLAVRP